MTRTRLLVMCVLITDLHEVSIWRLQLRRLEPCQASPFRRACVCVVVSALVSEVEQYMLFLMFFRCCVIEAESILKIQLCTFGLIELKTPSGTAVTDWATLGSFWYFRPSLLCTVLISRRK
jgi:hypothetical protein